MLKLSVKYLGSASSRGATPIKTPELAMAISMSAIPASSMGFKAFFGSSKFVFSMPTRNRREPLAVNSFLRPYALVVLRSRTEQITI